MLELGVDELTVVLRLDPTVKSTYDDSFEWQPIAEFIIDTFAKAANFPTIFGEKSTEGKAPKGYKISYRYGEHNFYLAVAYHPYHMSMGVAIKFSAQAFDYYCEVSGLQVHSFLQTAQDTLYTMRISRIDFTADYIDEGINVTNIYQSLIDGKVGIFREQYNKRIDEFSFRKWSVVPRGFLISAEVPTIYIGSVQSNAELRIYDKRREQIERKGSKFDKALKCRNWVRFEGVFRHEYAHQISAELMKLQSDDELANLIACTMAQKFRFMYIEDGVVDCETEYTQMLIDVISNNNFALKASSSRNFELATSLLYMFHGSGVITTLYKIKEIWGDDAVATMLDFAARYLQEYEPNDDCRYWLMKNTADYKKNYPDFDVFLRDNLLTML